MKRGKGNGQVEYQERGVSMIVIGVVAVVPTETGLTGGVFMYSRLKVIEGIWSWEIQAGGTTGGTKCENPRLW